MSIFSSKVTIRTIKQDASIARLDPIAEAIKNAIDNKAKNIKIFLEHNQRYLFQQGISLVIEDDGNGFDIENKDYIETRWTHYKGGEYIKGTLGGRSRGRYSYLKLIDFDEKRISDIRLQRIENNQIGNIVFNTENNNVGFKIFQENNKEPQIETKTKLEILNLGDKYLAGREIDKLIEDIKKEIIITFADKLFEQIAIFINNKKIEIDSYILAQDMKIYDLDGASLEVNMIVWNNDLDLEDKKHAFIFNNLGNCLGKIPSGARKTPFNCHSVYLKSEIFQKDLELIEIDTEAKNKLEKAKKCYKDDLDKLLIEVWEENRNIMAQDLARNSKVYNQKIEEWVKNKIEYAYRVLSAPLMLSQQGNFSKNKKEYISNSLLGMVSESSFHTLVNLNLVFGLDEKNQEILSYVHKNLDLLALVKKYYENISRLDFLTHFENLVLNEGKNNTKERTELHKIIENNLWIFGDEYANLPFFSDQALRGIFAKLGMTTEIDESLNTIPDLFIPQIKDNTLFLIELKAPKVKIIEGIISDVKKKYIVPIIREIKKQKKTIDKVVAWCISSEVEETLGRVTGSNDFNFEITPKTWGEIIKESRETEQNKLKVTLNQLELSHYYDLSDFKQKEIEKEKTKMLHRANWS